MKIFAFLLLPLALAGCGDKPVEQPKETPPIQTASTSQPSTEDKAKIDWYQDDLSQPVKMVGVSDPKKVMASAGLKPVETENSSDSKGEPKKIYTFRNNTSLTAHFEHSPNRITLLWFQAFDDAKAIKNSQQSLKDIYLISRALFGKDGADAVRRVSIGGKYRDDLVGGYKTNGQCVNVICTLNFDLKP